MDKRKNRYKGTESGIKEGRNIERESIIENMRSKGLTEEEINNLIN